MGFRENRIQTSDFVWVDALNSITDSDSEDDVIFIQNYDETVSDFTANKRMMEPHNFRQLFLNDSKKTTIISRYLSKNQEKTTSYPTDYDIDSTSVSDDSTESDIPIEAIRNPVGERRVSFSTSEVRVYSITIGDHPSASCFPISLDWNYSERQVFDVESDSVLKNDNNEEYPNERQYKKAFRKVMRLDPQDRFARILEVTGMSASEVERLECHRQLDLRKERQMAFFRRRKRNSILQLRFSS
jgi:hypothetical protein